MIVYDGLKTDFLSSCENDSIAIEIEENILSKLGRHTPKAEFRSWENSLNYMYLNYTFSSIYGIIDYEKN